MFTRLSNIHTISTESADADGIYYVARIVNDDNPDTSYLDQTEFAGRRRAYRRGDFTFTGLIVTAYDDNDQELGVSSLWGIESDSEPEYYREVAAELANEAYSA